MTKSQKFAATTIWILFSRSYDAYCTNQLTPDLSNEANPLVSLFGLSWTPLLLILSLLTVYVIYTSYLATFKTRSLLPKQSGYTFSNIVAYTYHGQKENWTSIFYKFPKDLNRFNHYMGHVMTRCLVFAGLVSTIMWLLINYTESYKNIHSAPLIYSILVAGCVMITYRWNREQYKQYLVQQAGTTNS